jgi:hypothetical protein
VYQSDYQNYSLTIPFTEGTAQYVLKVTTAQTGCTPGKCYWTSVYFAPNGTCEASISTANCVALGKGTPVDGTWAVTSISHPVTDNPSGYFTCLDSTYTVKRLAYGIFLISSPASPGTWIENNIENCARLRHHSLSAGAKQKPGGNLCERKHEHHEEGSACAGARRRVGGRLGRCGGRINGYGLRADPAACPVQPGRWRLRDQRLDRGRLVRRLIPTAALATRRPRRTRLDPEPDPAVVSRRPAQPCPAELATAGPCQRRISGRWSSWAGTAPGWPAGSAVNQSASLGVSQLTSGRPKGGCPCQSK